MGEKQNVAFFQKDKNLLPVHILDQSSQRNRRQQMRENIKEFLLDNEDDAD